MIKSSNLTGLSCERATARPSTTPGRAILRALAVGVLLLAAPGRATAGESFSPVIKDPEKLLHFLTTTGGRSLLVFLFFLSIVLLLRYLLGPGGKLRDPQWDKLNSRERELERARRNVKTYQARLEELAPELEAEIEKFKNYVAGFLSGDTAHDAMYLLKQEHSLNVLGHAISIAAQEEEFLPESWRVKPRTPKNTAAPNRSDNPGTLDAPAEISAGENIAEPDRILLLAALYHDIGRFEQLRRYNTFRDADSLNHAELGASLLAELAGEQTCGGPSDEPARPGFMSAEPAKNLELVCLAVQAHNHFALPETISPQLAAVCHAVRDADKLDILRIMATELTPDHPPDPTVVLGLLDEPEKYTQSVLKAVQDKQQVKYAEMRYINDFRLLLCSWLNNIIFPSSRRILAKNSHLDAIMSGLPDAPPLRALTDKLREELEEYRQN